MQWIWQYSERRRRPQIARTQNTPHTMDLTSIFLFCLISLVIGAVLMILVQYYVFVKYFNGNDDRTSDDHPHKSINEKYQLPDVSVWDIYVSDSMRSIQLAKYANSAACAWAFYKMRTNNTKFSTLCDSGTGNLGWNPCSRASQSQSNHCVQFDFPVSVLRIAECE